MLFFPPVLQLIIFGFAVNLDVDTVKVAWADSDGSPPAASCWPDFKGLAGFT